MFGQDSDTEIALNIWMWILLKQQPFSSDITVGEEAQRLFATQVFILVTSCRNTENLLVLQEIGEVLGK